jgi:hypothetical protein
MRGKITFDQGCVRRLAVLRPANALAPAIHGFGERRCAGVGHQCVFGSEVAIEPTMRQAGGTHHVIETRLKPLLAEQPR